MRGADEAVEAAVSQAHDWHGRCADWQAEHLAQAADAADQRAELVPR